MPSLLSTTYTSAKLEIAISTNGSHQLALRRMSVNVLRGATKVSTTRSTSESGGCSSGGAVAAELIGSPLRKQDAARLYHSQSPISGMNTDFRTALPVLRALHKIDNLGIIYIARNIPSKWVIGKMSAELFGKSLHDFCGLGGDFVWVKESLCLPDAPTPLHLLRRLGAASRRHLDLCSHPIRNSDGQEPAWGKVEGVEHLLLIVILSGGSVARAS